jgi:yecA family protein
MLARARIHARMKRQSPASAMSIDGVNADVSILQPPRMGSLGAVTFTPEDREVLSDWLAQEGWPRGTMDIIMLEGYLVALLAWPVTVQPGAWLPPIWGLSGWKIPGKFESHLAFHRFTGLVIGFLQDLDRQLLDSPSHFIPALPAANPEVSAVAPAALWAQGFIKALQLSAEGMGLRSNSARQAVTQIASCASFVATGKQSEVRETITTAVLTLAAERPSRGPLGVLSTSGSARFARR